MPRPKSKPRRWTAEEDQAVLGSHGKKLRALAGRLNRSYGAVRTRRTRLKDQGGQDK